MLFHVPSKSNYTQFPKCVNRNTPEWALKPIRVTKTVLQNYMPQYLEKRESGVLDLWHLPHSI